MSKIHIVKGVFFLSIFLLLSIVIISRERSNAVFASPYAAYDRISLTPTFTPSPTYTVTPTPTFTPTSVPTAIPTPTSRVLETNLQISNSPLLEKVNEYRRSKGLSDVKEDPYTCALAKKRVEEITSDFSHNGFEKRKADNSFNYPSWTNVTENIARLGSNSNPVEMWINSPTHRENMERDTPYVCIENSGEYYVYEGWKP